VDNDCDYSIDERCGCDSTSQSSLMCGSSVGECIKGTQTCLVNDLWDECRGYSGPTLEICDGKDNDCDGQVDEAENLCTNGLICYGGSCIDSDSIEQEGDFNDDSCVNYNDIISFNNDLTLNSLSLGQINALLWQIYNNYGEGEGCSQ